MQVVGHGIHLSAPFRASSCCQESCWNGVVVDDEVVCLKTLFEWPGAIDSGLRRGLPNLTKRPTTLHGKVAFSGKGEGGTQPTTGMWPGTQPLRECGQQLYGHDPSLL